MKNLTKQLHQVCDDLSSENSETKAKLMALNVLGEYDLNNMSMTGITRDTSYSQT